jgi:hypothetical protein
VCTLRNRFSRHEGWKADGGAGVGLSWRTVAGHPVSCHEDEEKGKFPSGRHFGKNQSVEPMQILLKDGIQGFVSVYASTSTVSNSKKEFPCNVFCTWNF